MPVVKPSLGLLRSLTDEHVLRALMETPRLTRAELAARTGLSKPTVSESVRRLEEARVLRDTGEHTSGPGRAGTYYALADDLGVALVVSIAPEGVVAEAVDVTGRVTGHSERQVARPARPVEVARAVRTSSSAALADQRGPARLAVVSAADPVDRASGRLVHLPDAPFLVGDLAPVEVLAPLLGPAPVLVDNDVNWAAQAERAAAPGLDDFAYLYLGEGLGCAIVAEGAVLRGSGGLAGEIAHLVARGPAGNPVPFTQVFADLGLRRPGSTAVDAEAVLRLAREPAAGARVLADLARAVGDVLAALVALADPGLVLIGGTWGREEQVLSAITAVTAGLPRPVTVAAARVVDAPALTGARRRAVEDLRSAVLAAPAVPSPA